MISSAIHKIIILIKSGINRFFHNVILYKK